MQIKPNTQHHFDGAIRPKSVEVYYEDGVPFLRYVGRTYLNNKEVQISIPKVGLQFENITFESEEHVNIDVMGKEHLIYYRQQIFVSGDDNAAYTILPVEMTAEEIGKLLGYPVVIKEQK